MARARFCRDWSDRPIGLRDAVRTQAPCRVRRRGGRNMHGCRGPTAGRRAESPCGPRFMAQTPARPHRKFPEPCPAVRSRQMQINPSPIGKHGAWSHRAFEPVEAAARSPHSPHPPVALPSRACARDRLTLWVGGASLEAFCPIALMRHPKPPRFLRGPSPPRRWLRLPEKMQKAANWPAVACGAGARPACQTPSQVCVLIRLFTLARGEVPLSAECGLARLNQSNHRGRSALHALDAGYPRPWAHSRKRVWVSSGESRHRFEAATRLRPAVGLGCKGPGEDMAVGAHPQRLGEATGTAGRPLVGHHPLGADTLGAEPAQGTQEETGGGVLALVCQHLDIGRPDRSRQQRLQALFTIRIARRIASVVVARPCGTCPIVPPSIPRNGSHHQSPGSNA